MISESCYWKDELYKCYRALAKFINQNKYFEASFVKAEKAIMLSAYILRKLDDAEKIPPAFLKDSITISYYNKANERVVDHYTSIDFDKNYNFDNEEKETNTTLYFLDQIIHSFSYCRHRLKREHRPPSTGKQTDGKGKVNRQKWESK